MKLSHTKLIVISGLVWFGIGFYLLQLGLNLLLGGVKESHAFFSDHYPLINYIKYYLGEPQTAAFVLVILALGIGYLKGHYVLGKSAKRGVERILSFPNPTSLKSIYSAKYYLLIGLMISLGISIKYLGLNNDIRGFIDAIIGSALINGSLIYFRLAQGVRSKT